MRESGVRDCFFVCPSMIGQTDPYKIKAFARGVYCAPR